MNHDPEAVYQDADFEMAAFKAAANHEAALRKQGICAHSWLQNLKCLHCGKQFKSHKEHEDERREILS